MVDLQAVALEHADRIAALEAECDGCRTNVLAGIQAEMSTLNNRIGIEPDPDSGVEGHGLFRRISVLTDILEPIMQEREQVKVSRAKRSERVSRAVAIGGVLVALLGVGVNFARVHPSEAAEATHTFQITDASDSR